MAIRILKGTKINGVDAPQGLLVLGLEPAAEAAFVQGGGAALVDAGTVSGGGISYATLASTPGTTPGERRTLSDGPDAGAGLVWAIPEGTSAYAWCWAIYPLASYL